MTMKFKARLFRAKPGMPLVPGVDAEAIAAAAAETRAAAARREIRAVDAKAPVAEAPAQVDTAVGMDAAVGGQRRSAPPADDPKTAEPVAPDPPKVGEIASPAEVDSETAIAAIRREGLTGRQLRMARRVAAKHNLAPTSDFDAVRLLRAKGIDPFDRGNVLQIVPAGAREEAPVPAPAASTQVAQAQAHLPQTVENKPPAVSQPQIKLPEDRAGEIWQIQQDIARRRRRKMLLLVARLAIFVLLPTLAVGWYFFAIATPMYATKSEFVIQQAENQAAGGLGGLFAGTGLATQQDSTTVQSYLQSRDAMRRLDADLGFRAHFSQDWIDPIQRLDIEASNEDAYEVFTRNVKVGYDPTEGILKMEVVAASPEVSEAFAQALIGYAEEQVDNLSLRLREDQMSGAEENFATAEVRVQEAQERVLALQERLGVLDPISETGSLMQQITQFEVQLRQKQLERDQILANDRPFPARVAAIEGDIVRLEALVAELRASMTEGQNGNASLARVTGELRIAEADLTTRQLLLQQAAQQLETARTEANRQVRYMAVGVKPFAPDEPTYPRAAENTALALVIFAGIYLMISLTVAVLREQVSA